MADLASEPGRSPGTGRSLNAANSSGASAANGPSGTASGRPTPHGRPRAAADPSVQDAPEGDEASPLQDVLADVGELKAWARHLLTAKLDTVKLKARHLLFFALFALVGLTTGAALMITGAVLLLSGVAEGVGSWLESPWLGKVLVAVAFFVVLTVAVLLVHRSVVRRFRTHLEKKYDALHARQRIHHGVDVEQRAHELAREVKHAE